VNFEYGGTAFEREAGALAQELRFSISGGQVDVKHRYDMAVLIRSERGNCSGVFISPQLVLTAAHCVCAPADPKILTRIVDSSACARSVVVVTNFQTMGSVRDGAPDEHNGEVRVHPRFRAEMEDGRLKSNIADLAVVGLEKPIKGLKIDFKLPEQEVSIDEQLTVVGLGAAQYGGKGDGVRRVGYNSVTDIVLSSGGTGAFLFRSPGAHTQAGDSGGPCFRENSEGRWLVGINSGHANSGRVSWFTSTFHYRTWIAEQLRAGGVD
jgi:hypothetical protein